MAVKAQSTGMVIIGGGVIKHHICNANLMVRARGVWVWCRLSGWEWTTSLFHPRDFYLVCCRVAFIIISTVNVMSVVSSLFLRVALSMTSLFKFLFSLLCMQHTGAAAVLRRFSTKFYSSVPSLCLCTFPLIPLIATLCRSLLLAPM